MSLTSKYSILLFSLIMAWLFLMPVQVTSIYSGQAVLAADTGVNKALGGLDNTANIGGIKASQTDLPIIIGKVIGAILAFVGVIFFALILWAGFDWMLAKGNEEKIEEAKETIFGAVLGLLVVLGAYAITQVIAEIFSKAQS